MPAQFDGRIDASLVFEFDGGESSGLEIDGLVENHGRFRIRLDKDVGPELEKESTSGTFNLKSQRLGKKRLDNSGPSDEEIRLSEIGQRSFREGEVDVGVLSGEGGVLSGLGSTSVVVRSQKSVSQGSERLAISIAHGHLVGEKERGGNESLWSVADRIIKSHDGIHRVFHVFQFDGIFGSSSKGDASGFGIDTVGVEEIDDQDVIHKEPRSVVGFQIERVSSGSGSEEKSGPSDGEIVG